MKVGSLYSGIGGLDWATETALGCLTAWQLDLTGADVRRRHWPDALQIEADVATVDPCDLPRVDVLCAGFACQDLSCAGKHVSREDLDAGARTGPTYRGVIRFLTALHPEIVVLENVPALLHHRARLEEDFDGYGLTWVRCGARDAGAPHIRRRVFVVGVRGGRAGGVIDAPDGGRWTPERAERAERTWASAKASDARSPGPSIGNGAREGSDGLACQVRTWPTPTGGDANSSGSRCLDSGAHPGVSLTDAIRPDRAIVESRTWSTPKGSDARGPGRTTGTRDGSDALPVEVRTWATPAARDWRTGELADRVGSEALNQQVTDYPRSPFGSRISADWVEPLQGLPVGWTLPNGPRLEVDPSPRWPRGRYPADWDRSVLWPGYDWEPARTLPNGPPVKGRPARLRMLGNAVCPQQGALAIQTALGSWGEA